MEFLVKILNIFRPNKYPKLNLRKLRNPKNWEIIAEHDESYEYDGYTRKPQRHYRHKIYTEFWINESYEFQPRTKNRVIEIFMEDYKKGILFEDKFTYIPHNRN